MFVRDLPTAKTQRVSVGPAGVQGDKPSSFPAISGNGRFVAFVSDATNLVATDGDPFTDVFVRDRQSDVTSRATVNPEGGPAVGNSSGIPSISADGRFVAFGWSATNLVADDFNGFQDVFVRDRQASTTSRASVGTGGSGCTEAASHPHVGGWSAS